MTLEDYRNELIQKIISFPHFLALEKAKEMVDRYIGDATTMEEHLEHCENCITIY